MIDRPREAVQFAIEFSTMPKIRTMREFAEQEIILPNGPYAGRKFSARYQPYAGLWFDAVDSMSWNRFIATGPTQSGKTLSCFVIPLLYHLFELNETVICGLPDMEMAGDKWREDFLPVINRTRFKDILPLRGGGSRGGKVESVTFRHGPTIKFMSGGGGDKARAAFTSRVVAITETDGMDSAGGTSREADKITQIEGRTRAFGDRKCIYMECTVSIEQGRTWQELNAGTNSSIVLPCPECGEWVTPEREHFNYNEAAETKDEAREGAAFCCPACGSLWTETQRKSANHDAKLLHDGQTITKRGKIKGEPKQTNTLGFRWNACNNLFQSAGDVASDEWRKVHSEDEDNIEKELCQFVWAIPYDPPIVDTTPLDADKIRKRQNEFLRGQVPDDTEYLTVGTDIGKFFMHWVVAAWRKNGTGHVVNYGINDVPSDHMDVELAILQALREYREMINDGFPRADGTTMKVNQNWIDAHYQPDSVHAFCKESGQRFRPMNGFGVTQKFGIKRQYTTPTQTKGGQIVHVGSEYHIKIPEKANRVALVHINADYWKSWVHARLTTPIGEQGCLALFKAPKNEHISFSKHLTAEKQVKEFIPIRGDVIRWEKVRQQNHFLDAIYIACAAAHFAGWRLMPATKTVIQKQGKIERKQRGGIRTRY